MTPLSSAAAVRIVWLAVAFIIFGIGFGLIWWPQSQNIDQVRSHARDLYEEANQNDAIVLRATDLRAAETRIQDDLLALGGPRSAGAVTAATLRLFNDEAKRLDVEVRSLAPAPTTKSAASGNRSLSGNDMTIGVRGPFRNVVNLIADLPRHDVLVEIHSAQIISSDTMQKSPTLDVTLDTTIYRVRTREMESRNVRALR